MGEWKKNPNDPRWEKEDKGSFDWWFTQGEYKDKDLKLADLPRPGGEAMKDFWYAFYDQGIYIAIIQGAGLIIGLYLLFNFAPFFLNGLLNAVFKVPIKEAPP